MRFWDASAITPLLVSEPRSGAIAGLLGEDEAMVVWWGTRIECASALRRREREGVLDAPAVGRSLALLDSLTEAWSEILPTAIVRAQAERALAVHPLRAADALQLAAALVWRRDATLGADLVSLDDRLRDAASREGFSVLPAELEA